jgi:pimeloyl-ACP methyl ester carboxylesterase
VSSRGVRFVAPPLVARLLVARLLVARLLVARLLVVLLLVALVPVALLPGGLVPAVTAAGAAAASSPTASVRWHQCRSDHSVECGWLTVPLDDTNPADARTIRLALTRVRARDPEHRIGSVLVNPGGPGAPGADFAPAIAGSIPAAIRDRFDIVGWDPRGTGSSAPIHCSDELDGLYALDWDPDTDAERSALDAANRAYVASCVRRSGALLAYVSSDRTARDMDRIRAALGDRRLTYVGFSYGTYLGALYASQFPHRVRALVLDGAVDPALDATQLQVEQAEGFEHALDLFFQRCARDSSCAFHGGGRPAAAYDALRARVDTQPVPAGRGRTLNGTLFDIGVAQLLYYGRSGWSTLAGALEAAERGHGGELVSYADLYTGRDAQGHYDNEQDAFIAIGCADGPPMGDVASVRAIEDAAAAVAPRLGRSIVNNSLACAFWPVAAPPPTALTAVGAPPILVLGTRDDPATPLIWAQGLARELTSASLVTVGGARHTAFASGNRCVDELAARYLVSLEVPRHGTRC